MINEFKKFKQFLYDICHEERVPLRDKKILGLILSVLVLRFLFIPDWIPYLGKIDFLILLGTVLDYLFVILDQNLILSHYPWGMKSFARLRRVALFLTFFAPSFITNYFWEYTKDPF
jgi:hypothetical protein